MSEEIIGQLLQDFHIAFGGWLRYQYKQMDPEKSLTIAQFQVLYKIKDLGKCKMSDLSLAIEVSRGTMTSMLNKMVDQGYVDRSNCLKDRRNVYVSLTPQGEERLKLMKDSLLKKLRNLYQAWIKVIGMQYIGDWKV